MKEYREMIAADIEEIVKIITAHQKKDGSLALEYYKQYFADSARLQSKRERNSVAVAEDGQIVGMNGFRPDQYDWPDILWLSWFYVAEHSRKKGIGSLLLRNVISEVRAFRIRKLFLDTSSDESYEAAVRLYRQFGFQEEGRLIDYYGPDEDYLIFGLKL